MKAKQSRIKLFLVSLWLLLLLSMVFSLFWKNELKYLSATPVPKQYKEVLTGEKVPVGDLSEIVVNRPLFLHFFNPECPCSKFNLPHVRSLIKKYGDQLQFAVVVIEAEKIYTEKDIQEKLGENVPVFFDKDIADQCGVYSTPQAVILDGERKLYYRGNYNKSRYCTNSSSNYAEMAIGTFLKKSTVPQFEQAALKAYGCELPGCTK